MLLPRYRENGGHLGRPLRGLFGSRALSTRYFVLRLYDRPPAAVIGTVEAAEDGERWAFRSVDELHALIERLTRPPRSDDPSSRDPSSQPPKRSRRKQ